MKVTTEHTPDCNAVVTVEVDDERIKARSKTAAQRISRARPIPGSGRARRLMRWSSARSAKNYLLDEAIDGMAQQIYREVLKDEKIDVYDSGKLDVVQKEPVVLKFTIPTRPVVTIGRLSLDQPQTEAGRGDGRTSRRGASPVPKRTRPRWCRSPVRCK